MTGKEAGHVYEKGKSPSGDSADRKGLVVKIPTGKKRKDT